MQNTWTNNDSRYTRFLIIVFMQTVKIFTFDDSSLYYETNTHD